MNDEYLSHSVTPKTPYRPRYYKKIKVPTDNDYRYFYSEREYQAYLKNQQKQNTENLNGNAVSLKDYLFGRRRKKDSESEEKPKKKTPRELEEERLQELKRKERQQTIDQGRKEQEHREQAIMQSREKLKEQERQRQEKIQEQRDAEIKRIETEEAAMAEWYKKTKLPNEVSLKDFIFGGQFKKDLKSSKKNLKKIEKELKKQNDDLADLDKQIEKLSKKRSSVKTRAKLDELQKQKSNLQASIVESKRQRIRAVQDYTAAICKYEGGTLVGRLGKRAKRGKARANYLINKYSKQLLSAIPTIKLKK